MSSENGLWSTLAGQSLTGGGPKFASPWQDYASSYVPQTMRGALELSEILYYRSGIYKKSTERIVDYFLTKLVVASKDDGERKKFEMIMNKDFGVLPRIREVDIDKMVYGNGFSSLHLPFKRVLRCVVCSSEKSMVGDNGSHVDFVFHQTDCTFSSRCKGCKKITTHKARDYAVRDASKIRLVRWDPKRITIEYNEITGDKRFWLDISPDIISRVRRADPFILATLPWSFIVAIKNGHKYRFNDDMIYHSTESSLAGVSLRGWGVPPVLSAFRNFFRLQVLYRYDEVMKMDYIVPLRIVSPAIMKSSGGNSVMEINLRNFAEQAMGAVERHRIDGADWNFFPFPVNYQAIGGEGQQLDQAQRDTILAEEDRLLNVRGIPPELYRGSLTLINAPVGLRLFEAGNSSLVEDNNRLVQWIGAKVSRFMECGSHESSIESVRITDSIEDKAWRVQAAQSGFISKETGLSPLGIDSAEEERRVLDEQVRQAREQQKAQQELQMDQMAIGSSGSDTEGGQAGGMSPGDVESMADEKARALLDPSVTESVRRRELDALANTNSTLHAVVIKKLDQYRNQAGNLGRAAGLQQMGIGGGEQPQGKTASQEQITELMLRIHQEFPSSGGSGATHSIRVQKNGNLVLRVFGKNASIPHIVMVSPDSVINSIEDVVRGIKEEVE